jgi:hypothetical protein
MADERLKRLLRGLEKAREFAKSYRFEMTDDYCALIDKVEAMACNQPGADKSHVWPAMQAYVNSFKLVKRAPRS